jgi:phenylacetate-CoA ligase
MNTYVLTLPHVDAADKAARLAAHLQFVRQHSPFYQSFYAGVAANETALTAFPVLDHTKFWQANTIEHNQVFTGDTVNGITFKSGGTSGQPKYSVYTNAEFAQFTQAFGTGMVRGGIDPGEGIGNMFYAGKLYASFLFVARCLEASGTGMCYPIAGGYPEETLDIWRQFKLTTLAGVPTTLISMLDMMTDQDREQLSLKKFLYGGEPMFADQVATVQHYFPGCEVRSIGIAGVDYGELGWVPPGEDIGVHRVFEDNTILEILNDETGEPIQEIGQSGKLVLTNLYRRLMPVIRYPVGDRGEWLDPEGTPWRRFRVLGRTEEGARIGPMTLYVEDIANVLATGLDDLHIQSFQIVVTHEDQRDRCTLKLAISHPENLPAHYTERLQQAVYTARSMYTDLIAQALVHPLTIEWVHARDLTINPRTGKLIRVLDLRHQR